MINKFIECLNIPDYCIINQRIPKKELVNRLSNDNKKLLNSHIEKLTLYASINTKSSNMVSVYDEQNDYRQLAVFRIDLKDSSKLNVISTFLQNLLPMALILVFVHEDKILLNFAEKRISQLDRDERVLGKMYSTSFLSFDENDELLKAFMQSLNYNSLLKTDLKCLYFDYISKIINYNISLQTKEFKQRDIADSFNINVKFDALIDIQRNILSFENSLSREKQLNKKMDINDKIIDLRDEEERLLSELIK